jgi:hypothetical protein
MANPAVFHTDIEFKDVSLGSSKLLSNEFNKVTKKARVYEIATAVMPAGARIDLTNDTLANNGSATVTVLTDESSTLGATPLPNNGSDFSKNPHIKIFRNGILQYKGAVNTDGDIGWHATTTIQINNELAIGEIISVEIVLSNS